ncbi:hypothetical protein RvY_12961-1 [Ramazzottius varieornatus]|uniref:UNC93-like protein MFSD11 n=1 Tax=Ramazzottius varieornatus TaxID=947166 RepID=A0A1D1VRM8_RAMVA|nr:hypothetical protein RvY_12961-1 [Ramazzottius varieornatus]
MSNWYDPDTLPAYTDLFAPTETAYFGPTVCDPALSLCSTELARDAEVKARRKIQFWNLVQTGFGYMFLLSSVQTALSVGTIVLFNIQDDKFHGTPTMGYALLGLVYCMLAVAYWLTPPVVAKLGPVNSMLICAVCFIFFLLSFIRPVLWLLIIAAVIAGFGSALLSTAGGVFMALNSDSETIGRNTGIFFGLYETSLIWGNVGFFFILHGDTSISTSQRYWIFGYLLILAVLGTILVAFLKRKQASAVLRGNEFARSIKRGVWDSIKAAAALFYDMKILMLCPLVIYLGFSAAFRNDIYNSSIGYTRKLNSLSLVGLAGIALGLGELSGSAACAAANTKNPHMSRGKIVLCGIICNYFAYLFIYLNLPSEANLGPTDKISIINPPNKGLAVFCSFLMGIGDSTMNVQIYAILAEMFGKDIVPSVGLYNSIYAIFCALAYFLSLRVELYAQMTILLVLGLSGWTTFAVLARNYARSLRYEDI